MLLLRADFCSYRTVKKKVFSACFFISDNKSLCFRILHFCYHRASHELVTLLRDYNRHKCILQCTYAPPRATNRLALTLIPYRCIFVSGSDTTETPNLPVQRKSHVRSRTTWLLHHEFTPTDRHYTPKIDSPSGIFTLRVRIINATLRAWLYLQPSLKTSGLTTRIASTT